MADDRSLLGGGTDRAIPRARASLAVSQTEFRPHFLERAPHRVNRFGFVCVAIERYTHSLCRLLERWLGQADSNAEFRDLGRVLHVPSPVQDQAGSAKGGKSLPGDPPFDERGSPLPIEPLRDGLQRSGEGLSKLGQGLRVLSNQSLRLGLCCP